MSPPKAKKSGRSEEPISERSPNPLSPRERTEAIVFYTGTAIATISWWILLWLVPTSRPLFLGTKFSEEWLWVLLAPDAISAFVGGLVLAVLIAKKHPLASALAWVHFGAQGYAWTISLGLAWFDPSAYIGLVSMTFSTGIALAFAIRLKEGSILWGPFQFAPAKSQPPAAHFRQSVIQTLGMWATFLAAIPITIFLVERHLSWDSGWRPGIAMMIGAGIVFVLGATIGLTGAWEMTQRGEGTPLPSACAKKLITTGSYRFVRNPMALGGIAQGVCVGIWFSSPLVVVYAVIGGVWWELLARGEEELFLARTFGDEYDAYRAHVRCWLPLPRGK